METKTLTLRLGSLIRILGPALSSISASEAADQNRLTLETREYPVANIANIGRSGNRGLRRSHSEGEIPLSFMESHFPGAWRGYLRTRGSEALNLELSPRDQEDSDRDIMIIDANLMLIEARNENQRLQSENRYLNYNLSLFMEYTNDGTNIIRTSRNQIIQNVEVINNLEENIREGNLTQNEILQELQILDQRIRANAVNNFYEPEIL